MAVVKVDFNDAKKMVVSEILNEFPKGNIHILRYANLAHPDNNLPDEPFVVHKLFKLFTRSDA